MTVYLVRHAHALPRGEWRQPDDIRPLDDKGRKQAQRLAEQLGDEPVKRILSSPAVRCLQTVEPTAELLGLDVERNDDLLEGADPSATIDLLHDVAANHGTAALCSHGDVIPHVLRRLAAGGMEVHDKMHWPKGSAWALEWDGQRFAAARFLTPDE